MTKIMKHRQTESERDAKDQTVGRSGRVTLSVGETAQRLGVSTDTIRNYCEEGLLRCLRTKGNHRRVLLSSIQAFEAQRKPAELNPPLTKPQEQRHKVDEDYEIYYVGNGAHPNKIEPGLICTGRYFGLQRNDGGFSSVLLTVTREFGGGNFKILRVREGEIVLERLISLPGPTKEDNVLVTREVALDL